MPHRGRRSHGKRPERRITYVQALESYVSQIMGRRVGKRWVRTWLLEHRDNRNSIVPVNAPCTMTTALRILFEFPFTIVARVVDPALETVVEIRDQEASRIFVLLGDRIIYRTSKEAAKFRFPHKTALEEFLTATAGEIRVAMRTTRKEGA